MRPLSPPRPAEPLDAAAISAYTARLFPFFDLGAALPAVPRLRGFGGRLFPDAPRLVRAVARALQRAPRLFSDVPFSGAALAARQERAEAWRRLRDALQALAAHANARFLEEQAGAIDDALAVLRQHELAARMPFCPADLAARRDALGEAAAVLERFRDKKRRGARQALKALRAAADHTPSR